MRLMDRNKRTIHVAARQEMGGVEYYDPPVAVSGNYRSSRANASMEVPGESVTSDVVLLVPNSVGETIREFDKVFVYVTPPAPHDPSAATADYIVSASVPGLNHAEVRLKRVQT